LYTFFFLRFSENNVIITNKNIHNKTNQWHHHHQDDAKETI